MWRRESLSESPRLARARNLKPDSDAIGGDRHDDRLCGAARAAAAAGAVTARRSRAPEPDPRPLAPPSRVAALGAAALLGAAGRPRWAAALGAAGRPRWASESA